MENDRKDVSRQELEEAMKQFLNKGGQIKVLPDQKGQSSVMDEVNSQYESLEAFSYYDSI
ncbi:MAG: hypothetical protein HQM12_14595 [SAR324 cluster bacterium]|nr:hypothetical protein [SAR324 cluster bacterium]